MNNFYFTRVAPSVKIEILLSMGALEVVTNDFLIIIQQQNNLTTKFIAVFVL